MNTKEKILFNIISFILSLLIIVSICFIGSKIKIVLDMMFNFNPYIMILIFGVVIFYLMSKI